MPFFPLCTVSPARLHSRQPCFARRPRLCPRVHFSRPSVCNNTGVRLCKRHVYAHLPCRNRPEKVALTFNCTYSAQDMQQLLEILKEKNVHATFFVSDAWAKNYPELLCTIHNAGHDIGGLWTTQASLSIREQTLTLENLTQRIDRLTDSETTLFRFEDGNYDNSAIRLIQESGGYPVQWNINSMDWKDYGAQDILHRILNSRQLQNGSILLFHAGTVYTAQALPDLIDNLEDQGYQPVPISELIWKHSYYMDADGVQIPKTEP